MLFWDIETNGLYYDVTKVHCMVIIDGDTNSVYKYTPEIIQDGIKKLTDALNQNIPICGHNIINYDIAVLEKLYPDAFKVLRE